MTLPVSIIVLLFVAGAAAGEPHCHNADLQFVRIFTGGTTRGRKTSSVTIDHVAVFVIPSVDMS